MPFAKRDLKIAIALSITQKAERRDYAEKVGVMAQARKYWRNGRICGQCAHFSQYGGRGSGLRGDCAALFTINRVEPWEKACPYFQSCKTKTTT